ncbi:16S rRNA (guanine(527)-N(7))-methyltransferase RsmG [Entomomonas asaccharolytica]|uniref:Ribosomal RNA small subunit methyltransferase G n=1 Tax=Entomomonas asaccharolytica TaxID=2785331 RepID=A0A974NFL5_9GAMM|nr:16S rRNA (guanine(527)-N(7))-methyltransferase RsmG [Entomomonas asaccharolytica]QQP85658.1 16S rRNA (guanine(527)-N(7))-methyltransferase RsmG [Entomomonas asaccharolytica]
MSLVTDQQAQLLKQGIKQLGLAITEQQQQLLLGYLELLAKWNKAYNLTAVRDINEMVSRHLLDSLSIVPYITGKNWLDVGSGGGMPGIPLAIMFPDNDFTLLDSNGKKTRFLTQVVLELKLTNVQVVNQRAESFHVEQPFSGIVSRAFSSLADFVNLTKHLANQQTMWFAMKGVYPEEELQTLPSEFKVESDYQLMVPNCEGQRHLLVIKHHQ